MLQHERGVGKTANPSKVRTRVPFAALPHLIAGDVRLRPVDRSVLLALAYFAKGDPSCWPSNESVGRRAGCSAASVKRSLARLEAAGHVTRMKVRPTIGNMTGRVIGLAWRVDDNYLDRPGGCVEEGSSKSTPPAAPIEPPGGAPVIPDRDRCREKEENPKTGEGTGRQRPHPHPGGCGIIPEEQSRDRNTSPTSPPGCSSEISNTPGQAAFLASLTGDQRVRFDSASADRKASLLEPFAKGYDPSLARMILAELPKSVPTPQASPPASTVEAIERLPGGQPSEVSKLAERFCRDFGTEKDRRLWGAFHKLGEQLWRGAIPVEAVLDSYRQATGPNARNRGAVFCHALKAGGWRP